jgi:hypothetical protein
VPRLGLLLAVIAVELLALVPIGWRGGWRPYRFSLLSLMAYSAYFGIAAVIVSVLALVISVFGRSAIGRRGFAVAILALAAGGLTAYVPWHYRALARSVPPIDDITTDTDNPPAFVAVIKLREAEDEPLYLCWRRNGCPAKARLSRSCPVVARARAREGVPDCAREGVPDCARHSEEDELDNRRGRSHDTPHRGERAKLLDGLHR